VLRHPRRVGENQLRMVDSPVRVAGLDSNPIRVYAYLDASQAALLNLAGATNLINVEPTTGTNLDALKRTLLQHADVASAQRVAAASEAITAAVSDYTRVLRVVEFVALALALLIAFNSASIAADERAREHATMFAFGIPLRTVLRNAMAEGGVVGLLATAVGVALGLLLVKYIVTVTARRVAPDLGATVSVSVSTILLAAVLGVVATAVAPVLTARKISRMDVPSTLRVVE
jgi:putative ABC transport system permease protein